MSELLGFIGTLLAVFALVVLFEAACEFVQGFLTRPTPRAGTHDDEGTGR